MVQRRGRSVVVAVSVVVGLLVGCQMMARGPSDEEQIRSVIDKFINAGNDGKIDTMMSCFAEDFLRDDGVDKEEVRSLFEEGIASGIEFDASDVEINIAADGKSAKAEGVQIDYTPYFATLEKRAGKWLIVGGGEEY